MKLDTQMGQQELNTNAFCISLFVRTLISSALLNQVQLCLGRVVLAFQTTVSTICVHFI